MPLVKCRECGELVSSKAEECPHCGLRLRTSHVTRLADAGCALLILGVLLFCCVSVVLWSVD